MTLVQAYSHIFHQLHSMPNFTAAALLLSVIVNVYYYVCVVLL